MKLRKFLAGTVAGMLAVGTMAASASAQLYIPEKDTLAAGTSVGTDMWLVQIYNTGERDASKPATDYGINIESIASIQFTIRPHSGGDFEYDPIAMPDDSSWGGGLVMSCGGYIDPETGENVGTTGSRNWCQTEWWGVREMSEPTKPLITVPTENENEWTITWANIDESMRFVNGSDYAQIGLKDWGSSMIELEVVKLVCYDGEGSPIIAFDGLGNVIQETETLVDASEERRAIVEAYKAGEGNLPELEDDTAAEEETSAEEGADVSDSDSSEAATDSTTTVTPATQGGNNTTMIIIIVCAVVVVVVVVIVIIAKKKK